MLALTRKRRRHKRIRAEAAATEFRPLRAEHASLFQAVWEHSEADELLERGWLQTTDDRADQIAKELRSRGYEITRNWEAIGGPRAFLYVDGAPERDYDPRAGSAWSEASERMDIVGHTIDGNWQGFIGDTYVTTCRSCGGRLLVCVIDGEVVVDNGEVASLCTPRAHLLLERRAF